MGPGTARQLAAVAHAGRIAVAGNFRHLQTRDQTIAVVSGRIIRDRLELRIAAGIFLHKLLAALVLVDRTQFRHDLSSLSLGLSEREAGPVQRSEERRVGKECVSTWRSRW